MSGKIVQQPGGITEQESVVVGAERQLRVDTARGTVRVHDGVTPGGFELPNLQIVESLIAGGETSSEAFVYYLATEADLEDIPPKPNAIAVVGADGFEDIYVWKSVANDGGGLDSNISGYWRRLDSRVGFYVRLWRAGCINMQLNGSEPGANQNTTAWLDNNVVKLWDGASYLAATPILFTRLLSKIGSYETGVIFPSRLADTLVEAPDLDLVTDTGWYKSKTSDAHAPTTTVSLVFHSKIDANTMSQTFYLQGSASRDSYVRFKAAGTWGSWVLVPGIYDARLGAVSSLQTDANSCLDSGFYHLTSAASNIPSAANGILISTRYGSTDAVQYWSPLGSNQLWMRRYLASAWQAWAQVGISTTGWTAFVVGLTSKATPVDADIANYLDSASSNVPVQATYLQVWTNYWKVKGDATYTALKTILTTLGNLANAAGVLVNDGAGVLSWGKPYLQLISSGTTGGAVSSIDIAFPAGYKGFKLVLNNVRVVTTSTDIQVRFSSNAGVSYKATAGDYYYTVTRTNIISSGTSGTARSGGASEVSLASGAIMLNTGYGIHGELDISNPRDAGFQTAMRWLGDCKDTTPDYQKLDGYGMVSVAADDSFIRVMASSGNIAAGSSWALYGEVG